MLSCGFFVLFLVSSLIGVISSLNLGAQCVIRSNNAPGVCTVISSCAPIWDLYERGLIRTNPPTVCSVSDRSVCCPRAEARVETTTVPARKIRISERKCKDYAQNIFKTVVVPSQVFGEPATQKKIDNCMHKAVSLIVGGEKASEAEFPHMAMLGYENGEPQDYVCGGSLISPQFVLTAAHCLTPKGYGSVKFVKLGTNSRTQNQTRTVTLNVKEIFQHPNYDAKKLTNDIGILKLDALVPLSEYILPICLPQKLHTSEKAVASGFGKTGFGQSQSRDLLKVTLERFTQEECQKPFGNLVTITSDSMICFGHRTEQKDSCNGDSGGPLQISNTEPYCTYTQIGLVSFGLKKCGTVGSAGAYTNVFHYLDWIEGIVWNGES